MKRMPWKRTFDIPMKLSFRMKVVESAKQFADNDRDVLFAKDAWLHLHRKFEPLSRMDE